MTLPYISYNHTSAELVYGKHRVEYGPSQIDERSGDYCLVIYKNGKEVFRQTNTQLLEVANGEGLKDLVIAGLISYLK